VTKRVETPDSRAAYIQSVTTHEASDGKISREYHFSGGYYARSEDNMLFDTPEEAEARAEEIIAERFEAEKKNSDWIKKDKLKSFAYNAGYHMREAKRCRAEAETHEEKAKLCSERAKVSPEEKK
jgi:SOS response regulatory protein OraA/RecX